MFIIHQTCKKVSKLNCLVLSRGCLLIRKIRKIRYSRKIENINEKIRHDLFTIIENQNMDMVGTTLFDLLPPDIILVILIKDPKHSIPLMWKLNDNMKNIISENIRYLLKHIADISFARHKFNDIFYILKEMGNLDFVDVFIELFGNTTFDNYVYRFDWTLDVILTEKRDIILFRKFTTLLCRSIYGSFHLKNNIKYWLHRAYISDYISDNISDNMSEPQGFAREFFHVLRPILEREYLLLGAERQIDLFWDYAIEKNNVSLLRDVKGMKDLLKARETREMKCHALEIVRHIGLKRQIWESRSYEMLKLFIIDLEVPLDVEFSPLKGEAKYYKESQEKTFRVIDIYKQLFDDDKIEKNIKEGWETPYQLRRQVYERSHFLYRHVYRKSLLEFERLSFYDN